MNTGATPGPEVIESGPVPRLIASRLRKHTLEFLRRLITTRVLVVVALLAVGVVVAGAAQQYRHRIATEDRVSLATGAGTSVSVDLATRTLLVDLVIDNRSPYAVTLVDISPVTPGLSLVPETTRDEGAATVLPARVSRQQQFETTLIIVPDCTQRLPQAPAFRVVVTSSCRRRHVVQLPPFGPLAQLWASSARSACFDKPE